MVLQFTSDRAAFLLKYVKQLATRRKLCSPWRPLFTKVYKNDII